MILHSFLLILLFTGTNQVSGCSHWHIPSISNEKMLIFVPSGYSMSSGELFSASFAWSMQLQTVSFCICSYSCLTITALSNPSSNIVVQGYRVHPRLNLHFFVSCSSYRTLISEKRLEYHFYLAILKMKGTITGFLSVSLPPIFSFNPFFNYNKHDLQCKSDHVSSLQKKNLSRLCILVE